LTSESSDSLPSSKRRHRGNRLADTSGLEQSLGGYRRPTPLGDAESLRPFDFAIVDDGDADAGHAVGRHPVLERLTSVKVALLHHGRGKACANTLNSMLNFGREHSLSREPFGLKEWCGETKQHEHQA
jgi:hypothetical protein